MTPLRIALVPVVTALAACAGADATPMVRARAAHDLVCAESTVRVDQQLDGTYAAIGCGKRAAYRSICEGTRCTVDRVDGPWRREVGPMRSLQAASAIFPETCW